MTRSVSYLEGEEKFFGGSTGAQEKGKKGPCPRINSLKGKEGEVGSGRGGGN